MMSTGSRLSAKPKSQKSLFEAQDGPTAAIGDIGEILRIKNYICAANYVLASLSDIDLYVK